MCFAHDRSAPGADLRSPGQLIVQISGLRINPILFGMRRRRNANHGDNGQNIKAARQTGTGRAHAIITDDMSAAGPAIPHGNKLSATSRMMQVLAVCRSSIC